MLKKLISIYLGCQLLSGCTSIDKLFLKENVEKRSTSINSYRIIGKLLEDNKAISCIYEDNIPTEASIYPVGKKPKYQKPYSILEQMCYDINKPSN